MKDLNFEFLARFEDHLDKAVNGNYARFVPRRDLQRMAEIVNEETGTVIDVNTSCSMCALKVLKSIGAAYFAEKSRRAKGSIEVAPESEEVAPESEEVAPESEEVAPESEEVAPESEEVAPESEEVAPTKKSRKKKSSNG